MVRRRHKTTRFAAGVLLASSLIAARAQTAEVARFARAVGVPPATAPQAVCSTLDASVMAHSASAAHNDLRLLATAAGGAIPGAEQPFVLAESGPAAVETVVLQPQHVQPAGSTLQFDLLMPARPFADLTLDLSAHNFVATARVWGSAQPGGARQFLGAFPVFDLDGLGHGLTLPLAESSLRFLHVDLAMRDRAGRPLAEVRPDLLQGVAVPPSRQRQTLYTEVQGTTAVETVPAPGGGTRTVALLRIPAHLPVERVAVTLDPAFRDNFRRPLTIMAWPGHPLGAAAPPLAAGPVWIARAGRPAAPPVPAEVESIAAGDLSRVRLPSGDPGLRPLDQEQMTADAVIGANLRDAATVEIAIDNGHESPLPIRAISLLMRRRSVCFRAAPGTRYTLVYGDPALPPPETDTTLRLDGPMGDAPLGAETVRLTTPADDPPRPYLAAHPDTLWAVAVALFATLGGTALHRVKRAEG